jgi:hypothetical protein
MEEQNKSFNSFNFRKEWYHGKENSCEQNRLKSMSFRLLWITVIILLKAINLTALTLSLSHCRDGVIIHTVVSKGRSDVLYSMTCLIILPICDVMHHTITLSCSIIHSVYVIPQLRCHMQYTGLNFTYRNLRYISHVTLYTSCNAERSVCNEAPYVPFHVHIVHFKCHAMLNV